VPLRTYHGDAIVGAHLLPFDEIWFKCVGRASSAKRSILRMEDV
jgi:hypothetical protein